MAILQSAHCKDQLYVPTPEQAGQVTRCAFEISLATVGYVAATDFIELGILPPFASIVDATLIGVGVNGNIAMGIMSGTVGDKDSVRTCGSELIAATAMTSTVLRLAQASAWAIPVSEVERSIGLFGSADIVAGAKSFKLILEYALG